MLISNSFEWEYLPECIVGSSFMLWFFFMGTLLNTSNIKESTKKNIFFKRQVMANNILLTIMTTTAITLPINANAVTVCIEDTMYKNISNLNIVFLSIHTSLNLLRFVTLYYENKFTVSNLLFCLSVNMFHGFVYTLTAYDNGYFVHFDLVAHFMLLVLHFKRHEYYLCLAEIFHYLSVLPGFLKVFGYYDNIGEVIFTPFFILSLSSFFYGIGIKNMKN